MIIPVAAKPALLLLLLGGLGAAGWVAVDQAASSSSTAQGPVQSAGGNAGGAAMGGGSVSGNASSKGGGNSGSSQGHSLDVTGTVVGPVAPGRTASLAVTLTNPNSQAILVSTVSGTITAVTSGSLPGRPTCDKNWYSLGTYTGSLRLESGARTTVQLPLVLANLSDVNQDNCKGATFTYTFSAAAQQA